MGLAVLGAAAAFAATSLAAPSPAQASACLTATCGMPAGQRPSGEIGTAEVAHRTQPVEASTRNAGISAAADFATVFFAADGGYLLAAHSHLRLI